MAICPKVTPSESTHNQWPISAACRKSWRVNLVLELSLEISYGHFKIVCQFNFSLCLSFFHSQCGPHVSITKGHTPVTILLSKLQFRACFPGDPTYDHTYDLIILSKKLINHWAITFRDSFPCISFFFLKIGILLLMSMFMIVNTYVLRYNTLQLYFLDYTLQLMQ